MKLVTFLKEVKYCPPHIAYSFLPKLLYIDNDYWDIWDRLKYLYPVNYRHYVCRVLGTLNTKSAGYYLYNTHL